MRNAVAPLDLRDATAARMVRRRLPLIGVWAVRLAILQAVALGLAYLATRMLERHGLAWLARATIYVVGAPPR